MLINQPKKVFRYQGFSARTIELLCNDELFLVNPDEFNDPLDCKPTIESDSDKHTLRTILTELIKRRVVAETLMALKSARLKGEKADKHAQLSGELAARQELATIAYNATNPDYEGRAEEAECWYLTFEIQRELLKQYNRGVCCFSAVGDNPLLWSHYGDQHRGICIGYGLIRVPKPKLHKVVYGGSRVVKTSLVAKALLENDPEAQSLLDRDVLLRKAPSWRYEREWRILGDRGVQHSSLKLLDVTFGIRCPNALKHALISALEARDEPVKFFEMRELRESFKLKRALVEIGELRAYFPRTARSGIEIFGPVKSD